MKLPELPNKGSEDSTFMLLLLSYLKKTHCLYQFTNNYANNYQYN